MKTSVSSVTAYCESDTGAGPERVVLLDDERRRASHEREFVGPPACRPASMTPIERVAVPRSGDRLVACAAET